MKLFFCLVILTILNTGVGIAIGAYLQRAKFAASGIAIGPGQTPAHPSLISFMTSPLGALTRRILRKAPAATAETAAQPDQKS